MADADVDYGATPEALQRRTQKAALLDLEYYRELSAITFDI